MKYFLKLRYNSFIGLSIISLLCVLFVADTYAQVVEDWVRTYHGPMNGGGIKLMTTHNDFIYVAGQDAGSAVAYDIVTIKYNTAGDSLWVRRYRNGSESQVTGIIADDNNNVYVTGYTSVSGMPRSYLIKYGSSGEVLWQKLYEGAPDTRSIGVGLDQQSNPYIGVCSYVNGTDWSVEAIKYNAATGDTIWTSRYDQSANSIEIPYAMTVDNSGNVYITGYSQDAGIIKSMLVKFNSNGDFQWSSLYRIPGITGEIQGRAIKVDDAGNIYVAGHAYNGQTTFVDFLVMKCYPNGDTAWVKLYSNSASTDEAYDLAVDNSGNVYVAGKSFIGGGGSNNTDYLTVKFSADGTQLWQALYDGPALHTEDEARAIVLDGYGDCYVTGSSSSTSLYNDGEYATIRYDQNGNQVWSIRHASGTASGIGIDSYCNIYVAGNLAASFATIKYSQPGFPPVLNNFAENFDGVTPPAFPDGWTGLIDVLITNTIAQIQTMGIPSAPSLPNAVFMMNGLDGSNGQPDTTAFVALVSPLVDFGENGGTVTFKANGNCPLQVGVMTDPNDASTFTMYEEVPITPEFTEYTVTINAAGTGHIAIKHSNESPVQVLFVDDVTYEKVVPVEMTSFTANVKNNGEVELQWRTSTETNNRGFEIERQVSSKQKSVSSQWERVGYVAGHGTTTEPNSYSFTDKEVKSGKYSYRLKQIDYDGSYEYSGTVEVEINMPEEFELSQNYPNPFNPATRIKYGTPQDGYISLKVYNTLGEEVAELVHGFTKAGNHEVTFNAGNLSSGIYIYKLESVNKVLVKKMMVLR